MKRIRTSAISLDSAQCPGGCLGAGCDRQKGGGGKTIDAVPM